MAVNSPSRSGFPPPPCPVSIKFTLNGREFTFQIGVSSASVPGFYVREKRGAVGVINITLAGDYQLTAAPTGTLGSASFSVQPASMVIIIYDKI
jgi:hypothetical protein